MTEAIDLGGVADREFCEVPVCAQGYLVEQLPVYRTGDAVPGRPPTESQLGRAPELFAVQVRPGRVDLRDRARFLIDTRRAQMGISSPERQSGAVDSALRAPIPGDPQLVLIENVHEPRRPDDRQLHRWFRPLVEEPTLFAKFADLADLDSEGIRSFAGAYGMLGGQSVAQRGPFLVNAEPLLFWSDNIRMMREAIELRRLIESGSRAELEQRLTIVQRKGESAEWKYVPEGELAFLFDSALVFRIDAAAKADRESVFAAAGHAVCAVANTMLAAHSQVAVTFDAATSRPTIRTVPQDLLGAMWYQFVEAFRGDVETRRCRVCNNPILVESGDARQAGRLFCTPNCKLKDYRRRQGEALRLHTEKQTPGAIAKATGTDIDTVRKWIKAAKKKGE